MWPQAVANSSLGRTSRPCELCPNPQISGTDRTGAAAVTKRGQPRRVPAASAALGTAVDGHLFPSVQKFARVADWCFRSTNPRMTDCRRILALAGCGRHCVITIFRPLVVLEWALESDAVSTGTLCWTFRGFLRLFQLSVNPCLRPPRCRGPWCVYTVCVGGTTLEYLVKTQCETDFASVSRPRGLWVSMRHPAFLGHRRVSS